MNAALSVPQLRGSVVSQLLALHQTARINALGGCLGDGRGGEELAPAMLKAGRPGTHGAGGRLQAQESDAAGHRAAGW